MCSKETVRTSLSVPLFSLNGKHTIDKWLCEEVRRIDVVGVVGKDEAPETKQMGYARVGRRRLPAEWNKLSVGR